MHCLTKTMNAKPWCFVGYWKMKNFLIVDSFCLNRYYIFSQRERQIFHLVIQIRLNMAGINVPGHAIVGQWLTQDNQWDIVYDFKDTRNVTVRHRFSEVHSLYEIDDTVHPNRIFITPQFSNSSQNSSKNPSENPTVNGYLKHEPNEADRFHLYLPQVGFCECPLRHGIDVYRPTCWKVQSMNVSILYCPDSLWVHPLIVRQLKPRKTKDSGHPEYCALCGARCNHWK